MRDVAGLADREGPAHQWARDLSAWGIPQEILDQAPELPWIHPVSVFTVTSDPEPPTPSHARAREATPMGGSVLDVGCGGGRAGFAIAPPAAVVVGVDPQPGMLAVFAATAAERGLAHAEVLGTWPGVAASAPLADVVVCHHVLFNVADIEPFGSALTAHARGRVVVEIPFRHPLTHLGPLWRRFWDVERPDGPTAADAAEALGGFGAHLEVWSDPRPSREAMLPMPERVRLTRIRLCLPATRDADVEAALRELGDTGPRRMATLWWDV